MPAKKTTQKRKAPTKAKAKKTGPAKTKATPTPKTTTGISNTGIAAIVIAVAAIIGVAIAAAMGAFGPGGGGTGSPSINPEYPTPSPPDPINPTAVPDPTPEPVVTDNMYTIGINADVPYSGRVCTVSNHSPTTTLYARANAKFVAAMEALNYAPGTVTIPAVGETINFTVTTTGNEPGIMPIELNVISYLFHEFMDGLPTDTYYACYSYRVNDTTQRVYIQKTEDIGRLDMRAGYASEPAVSDHPQQNTLVSANVWPLYPVANAMCDAWQ